MRTVWELASYDPAAPVWRLEYQVRREALRELHVSELPDIDGKLGGLWDYLARDWLRLTVPVRGDRPERWPVDPDWQQLRGADFGAAGGALIRERKRSSDMHRLESQLFGLLVSHAALARRVSLAEAMRAVKRAHQARLRNREEEFPDLVAARVRRMDLCATQGSR
jgi:hypothetical protein